MKKTMITLAALLIVGFMAATAFAWGHQGRRGGCNGQGPGQGMYNNLTDEQKTELQELRQQFVDQTYETRSEMMTKHQQLRMLMETSSPDKAKLQALSDEVMDLKKALADKRIDFALKAKKIAPELNPMGFGRHGNRMGKGGFGCGYGQTGFNGGNNATRPCNWTNTGQQTIQ